MSRDEKSGRNRKDVTSSDRGDHHGHHHGRPRWRPRARPWARPWAWPWAWPRAPPDVDIKVYEYETWGINYHKLKEELNKVSLSAYDDKRYILADGVSSYAYGHYMCNLENDSEGENLFGWYWKWWEGEMWVKLGLVQKPHISYYLYVVVVIYRKIWKWIKKLENVF